MADAVAPAAALNQLQQTRAFGPLAHLPDWQRFAPATVGPALLELLATTEARFEALETSLADAPRTWAAIMEPLERLHDELGALFGWTMHLISVCYSDELQAAYDAARPGYVQLASRMAQSTALFEAMVALRDSDEGGGLDGVRARILAESIRGMARSGVHLKGDARARYQEIRDELSELSNRFSTNLVKEEQQSRVIVEDPAELDGIPPALTEQALQNAIEAGIDASADQGPWHFVVNGVNYMAVAQNGTSAALRERFYRAFRQRGSSAEYDNRPVVARILALRQESAQLLGFDHYAAYSIDAKMAEDTAAVWALMRQLETAARPVAVRERTALERFMRDELGDEQATLAPWDVAFWAERQQESLYSYDSEALRAYFQLPRVLDGLFELVTTLYGVRVREAPSGAVPVWHDDVTFYEVLRDDQVIAGFYVDPLARPGEKRGGAWMNDVVGRSRLLAPPGASASLPVALFVMNARPPGDGRPGLMSLDEVRTLFHEFGHATQHMFTQIDEGGASGMNLVEWDAV
ncbi:MAG: M3 family metallopeptidase, partial [Pseudomonadota bacterium]